MKWSLGLLVAFAVGCGAPFTDGLADPPPDSNVRDAAPGSEGGHEAGGDDVADAGEDTAEAGQQEADPPDAHDAAPEASCTLSQTTPPLSCFSANVVGPAQYGFVSMPAVRNCAALSTPPECQCAGEYACACVMASGAVPACPIGTLSSCLISYPSYDGGIVLIECN